MTFYIPLPAERRLRLRLDNTTTKDILCDIYRGADGMDGTISCELVNQLLTEASAPPFVPVETNLAAGQVCLRDVMRPPGVPMVQNALIRDPAGSEFSTGPLANNGSGCFKLDETYASGSFDVISFDVNTSDAGSVNLGHVVGGTSETSALNRQHAARLARQQSPRSFAGHRFCSGLAGSAI